MSAVCVYSMYLYVVYALFPLSFTYVTSLFGDDSSIFYLLHLCYCLDFVIL